MRVAPYAILCALAADARAEPFARASADLGLAHTYVHRYDAGDVRQIGFAARGQLEGTPGFGLLPDLAASGTDPLRPDQETLVARED